MTEPTERKDDPVSATSAAPSKPQDETIALLQSTEARARLVERVKNILLKPKAEWEVIDQEPASIAGIYFKHVIPLAAIPALATLIGSLVFGYSLLGVTYRPPLVPTLISALVQYGLTLAGVFVLALVIDMLAPKFEATANKVQAFKVAAYSATAAWVAGIFGLVPALSMLTILGLYSLYLLYLGLPRLMRAPQEKALSYTAVVVVVMIAIGLVIGLLTAPLARMAGGGSLVGSGGLAEAARKSDRGSVTGQIKIPGVGSIDVGALESMGESLGDVKSGTRNPIAAPAKAIDSSALATLLPETLGGLTITERENSSMAAGGVGGARAFARYGEGDTSVKLEITDMAMLGGLGALAGAMNVESNRESSTGYERTGRVDGRMTTEKWNSTSRRGSYGIFVGNRVLVQAEGRGVDIKNLKAAVHGLDLASLERAVNAK